MTRNRIDVHSHYVGDVLLRWMKQSGFRPKGGYKIAPWTVDGAIEFMDRHDIATQLLSVPMAFTGSDSEPDFPARLSRDVNEVYAQLIKDHPDRFGAFATVPLHSTDAALTEIAYALDVLALDGVTLPSNAGGHYFGQPFFEPILSELSRRQVPVFVHPADSPCADILGFGRPSSVIEFPMDTARNITNAIYAGVFQRHTGLRLILAHGGGALPTLGWRIAAHADIQRGPDDADIDAQHVAQVLRGLYYETALAGSAHSLLPTLQVTDYAHILFGTDFPAAPDVTITRNTANLVAFDGLSVTQRRAVEGDNARRLFPRLIPA